MLSIPIISILQKEKQRQLKTMLEEQERLVSKELERRKHQELRDEKVRQRIREESDEIKALEQKLKTAYLNKERNSQVEEQKLLDEMRRVWIIFFHRMMIITER